MDRQSIHIFMRALIHDLRGNDKHVWAGAAKEPGHRVVQAGLFDRGILCQTHEAALGGYDNYGIEFCRTFHNRCSHPAPNIWCVRNVDGDQLARFWLAALWRFGVSNLPEAAEVKLGPFQDRLRDILFFGASCSLEPAISMFRYRSRVIQPDQICFAPYATRFPVPPSMHGPSRLRAWCLTLAGFYVFVKLDSRPLPQASHNITINSKTEIQGGYVDFESSDQLPQAIQIANNMHLRRRPPRNANVQ
jgi:hypothetical protein